MTITSDNVLPALIGIPPKPTFANVCKSVISVHQEM